MSNNPRKQRIDAFISSTSIDLPDYRTEVVKVLNTLGIFPNGMEHWPVTGENPVDLCKHKVDDSEIYIGIYAYRLGWQPDGFDGKSITELEYDWAADVIRDGKPIPRLCFIMSDEHPWPESKKEKDKQAELDAFKKRVKATHAGFFTTPDNLAKQLTAALHELLKTRYPAQAPVLTRCRVYEQPPAYFAGRADILDTLRNALTAGDSVAVTAVRGIGGMGKTTLVQKLADQLATDASQPFGIMLWAGIGQLATEETEHAILRKWARDLAGVDLPGDQDAATLAPQVTAKIANAAQTECREPILLILDDVWPESLAMAKRLRKIVPPGTRILVTTRTEAVAIDLDCAEQPLGKLSHADGAQMLHNLLKPSALDQAKLETLSDVLGGHPLALRLASRAVKRRKVGGIDAVIADFQRGLHEGTAFADLRLDTGDAKEDSVSVTLQQTLDTLTEPEQAHFRALGALPLDLSFSRDHVYALWGSGNDPALEACLDKFLLEGLIEDAPDQPGRYVQHRLLRAYARGLLRKTIELEAVQRRHFAYIIAFADDLFRDEKIETWDNFSADYPQIAAVGDELVAIVTQSRNPVEQDSLLSQWQTPTVTVSIEWCKTASDFAAVVWNYIWKRRIGNEAKRWLWLGLMAAQIAKRQDKIVLFSNQLGIWFSNRGFKDDALKYYTYALAECKSTYDKNTTALGILQNIGMVSYRRGKYDEALKYYDKILQHSMFNTLPSLMTATIYNNIGLAYAKLKNFKRAKKFYRRAYQITVSDPSENMLWLQATVVNNIGQLLTLEKKYDKALTWLNKALPLRQKVNDQVGRANTLANIAVIYIFWEQPDQALDALLTAQQVIPDDDLDGQSYIYVNMGTAYELKGDFEQAFIYMQKGVQIEEQIEHSDLATHRTHLEALKRKLDDRKT